jgi:AcrR family transcriptional regulator
MTSTASESRTIGRPRDLRASSAIIAAARRQLNELGYARMSMESVAAEAGVSRATCYRRYRDKADLVTSAIAPVPSLGDLPITDFRLAVVEFLERLEQRLGGECFEVLATLLAAREDPRAIALHRERTIVPRWNYLLEVLQQARTAGELATDADCELAVEMLIGSVFARLISGITALPGWSERAVASVWQGMAPQKSPRRRVATITSV